MFDNIPYARISALQFLQHRRRISRKILHQNGLQLRISNRQLPPRERNERRYRRVLETLPEDFFAYEAARASEDDFHTCGEGRDFALLFLSLLVILDLSPDFGLSVRGELERDNAGLDLALDLKIQLAREDTNPRTECDLYISSILTLPPSRTHLRRHCSQVPPSLLSSAFQ